MSIIRPTTVEEALAIMRDPKGQSYVPVPADFAKKMPADKDLPPGWKYFSRDPDGSERYQRLGPPEEIQGPKNPGG